MKNRLVIKLASVMIGALWLCPLNLSAADLPGHESCYDVKSSFHFKIGYYCVKIYPATENGNKVYKMESTFHLSYKKLFSKYVYHSTDTVIVDEQGVVGYEINENKDGVARHIFAVRKEGKLSVTTCDKKGGAVLDKKSFNVSDYDYTQFETRFPISFSRFQVGQVKRSRVFLPAKNCVAVSDVAAKEIRNVSWDGKTRRVLVLETTSKEDGKATTRTTSWVLDNEGFLFHEGRDYSLHRTTKEKALSIR